MTVTIKICDRHLCTTVQYYGCTPMMFSAGFRPEMQVGPSSSTPSICKRRKRSRTYPNHPHPKKMTVIDYSPTSLIIRHCSRIRKLFRVYFRRIFPTTTTTTFRFARKFSNSTLFLLFHFALAPFSPLSTRPRAR